MGLGPMEGVANDSPQTNEMKLRLALPAVKRSVVDGIRAPGHRVHCGNSATDDEDRCEPLHSKLNRPVSW